MKFKEWLLSEEIFPNKTGTVYHRTCQECDEQRSVKSVSGILTKDYRIGDGCKYGCGLYTTFAIESQFNDYMQMYGKAIVQFKVTDLDKYLIFQLSVAKQIHGKDYKISDQLKKLGLPNKVEQSKLKEYDEIQEKVNYSSDLAEEFYKQNDWIVNSVKGIIYYGKKDGYCLLKYPTVQDGTITMLRYAVAEATNMKKMEELKSNIGWNGSNSSGFAGLPGGCRSYDGDFNFVGASGFWWSSTESQTDIAYSRYLSYSNVNVSRSFDFEQSGFSVRCLRLGDCNFVYSAWTACSNNIQTRTYT